MLDRIRTFLTSRGWTYSGVSSPILINMLDTVISAVFRTIPYCTSQVLTSDCDGREDTALDGLLLCDTSTSSKRYSLEHATTRYLQLFEETISRR